MRPILTYPCGCCAGGCTCKKHACANTPCVYCNYHMAILMNTTEDDLDARVAEMQAKAETKPTILETAKAFDAAICYAIQESKRPLVNQQFARSHQ